MAITHAFVSAKDDGADTTLVRPIDWNAVHTGGLAESDITDLVTDLAAKETPVGAQTKVDTHAALLTTHGLTVKALASDQALTSTTAAKITGLDQTVGAGTYQFKYLIRYQSTTATVGVKFDVNHSGTVTSFVFLLRYTGTGTTASSGAASMAAAGATGQVYEAFGRRAKGTAGFGTTVSSDSTGDMLTIIEGLMVVTVSGDLQLYAGLETGTSGVSIMANSSLILTKIV